jgi:hypothetical protein
MKFYYLAKVEMVYAAKNKLCKAIQDYLKEYNRILISDKSLPDVMDNILNYIYKLNKNFPKCSSVTPSYWTTNEGDEMISFGMDSIIVFGFYKGYLI